MEYIKNMIDLNDPQIKKELINIERKMKLNKIYENQEK